MKKITIRRNDWGKEFGGYLDIDQMGNLIVISNS